MLVECAQPGASVAKVALAHGLNANLVHAWRKQQRDQQSQAVPSSMRTEGGEFIALPMAPQPAPAAVPDIRIELRRGATTVSIEWPGYAAGECAAWLREWLR